MNAQDLSAIINEQVKVINQQNEQIQALLQIINFLEKEAQI